MADDYKLVITWCKRFEGTLERDFGGQGRGLHEKLTSVESSLPPPLVKKLRFIATVRNKLVHETGMDRLDDRSSYERACREAAQELKRLRPRAAGGMWRVALAVAAVVAALLLIAMVVLKMS